MTQQEITGTDTNAIQNGDRNTLQGSEIMMGFVSVF